jgi:enoyl-[acyl-carrier-protein] reductase (NADH)
MAYRVFINGVIVFILSVSSYGGGIANAMFSDKLRIMGTVTTDDLKASTWELAKQNIVAYNVTSGLYNEAVKFYHSQTSDNIIGIEQAKEKAHWSGVDLDFGDAKNISKEELEIMITDKRRENYRNFLYNHKKDSFATDVADLGSSFIGQMLGLLLVFFGGVLMFKGLVALGKCCCKRPRQ